MMKHKLLLLFLIATASQSMAQIDSGALQLTQKYFFNEIRNYKSVLVGEAKDQAINPKKVTKDAKLTFELLDLKADHAMVAVTIENKEGMDDFYTFLVKEDPDWKISAFRALWLPGFYYTMLNEFNGLDDEGIKGIYDAMYAHNNSGEDTTGSEETENPVQSLDDFIFEIKNMRLTIESDQELINHFNKNQEKFNVLLKKIKSDTTLNGEYWSINNDPGYVPELHELLLSSVSSCEDCPCITFDIGGMIDNSVGYFYCKNADDVPEISDHLYIMIRKLGDGWYLFKTT